jgi:hypothetical protein
MTQIILTDDQVSALQIAAGTVEVRDRRGALLGYLSRPASHAEIAEARRRLESDGPWYTTQQVLDDLDSPEHR